MTPTRRLTLGELRYRKKPTLATLQQWSTEFSTNMLTSVWEGFDQLSREVFTVDPKQAEDDIERSITELLEPRIQRHIPDHAPYYLQHASAERESRSKAPAQPPIYDLAFVFWEDETFKWPLEAKVLKADTRAAVSRYVSCLREKFLTFKYSPFSSEAAMLGYLFSGQPGKAFISIAEEARCELAAHPEFSVRNHMISEHVRTVPENKKDRYTAELRCHHLMMAIEQCKSQNPS
jgi:hypothetical protein